jgi:hypothetical protein
VKSLREGARFMIIIGFVLCTFLGYMTVSSFADGRWLLALVNLIMLAVATHYWVVNVGIYRSQPPDA